MHHNHCYILYVPKIDYYPHPAHNFFFLSCRLDFSCFMTKKTLEDAFNMQKIGKFRVGDIIIWGLADDFVPQAVVETAVEPELYTSSIIAYGALRNPQLWCEGGSHASVVSIGGDFNTAWIVEDVSDGIQQILLKNAEWNTPRKVTVLRNNTYQYKDKEINLFESIFKTLVQNFYAPTIEDGKKNPTKNDNQRKGSGYNYMQIVLLIQQFYKFNKGNAKSNPVINALMGPVYNAIISLFVKWSKSETPSGKFVCSQLVGQMMCDAQYIMTQLHHNKLISDDLLQKSVFHLEFNDKTAFAGVQSQIESPTPGDSNRRVFARLSESQLVELCHANDLKIDDNTTIEIGPLPHQAATISKISDLTIANTHILMNLVSENRELLPQVFALHFPEEDASELPQSADEVESWINANAGMLSQEDQTWTKFIRIALHEAQGSNTTVLHSSLKKQKTSGKSSNIRKGTRFTNPKDMPSQINIDKNIHDPDNIKSIAYLLLASATKPPKKNYVGMDENLMAAISGPNSRTILKSAGGISLHSWWWPFSGWDDWAKQKFLQSSVDAICTLVRSDAFQRDKTLQKALKDKKPDHQKIIADYNLLWSSLEITNRNQLIAPDISAWRTKDFEEQSCNVWGFVLPSDFVFALQHWTKLE